MIKATVTTENDDLLAAILKELVAINITVISQLRENFPFLTVDDIMKRLNEMTKYGLDNYEEESEHD